MYYYRFYMAEHRASTFSLTDMQNLAYRLMIDEYMDTESPLEGSAKEIAGKVRLPKNVKDIELVLGKYFIEIGGEKNKRWCNKKLDDQITRYHVVVEAARNNGKKGGRPKVVKIK